VRERIQINGRMISEDTFANTFFEMWQRFDAAAAREGKPTDASPKPVYFRYLTLMAFHLFLQEGVDTAVIECGIGGEYDSTNVISSPTVAAITALGFDHIEILGKDISQIAWHKSGIMKHGAAAFTVPQPPEALDKLQSRAEERNVQLQVVNEHPQLLSSGIKLGLEGSFQRMNASLAIAATAEHLHRLGHGDIRTNPLPPEFVRGLEEARIGGRCETRREPHVAWHLDGAHTIESIRVAAEWFAGCLEGEQQDNTEESNCPRILIFNQQTRDAEKLLKEVYKSFTEDRDLPVQFTHVIFCSNKTFKGSGYSTDLISVNTNSEAVDSLAVQKGLEKAWRVDIKGDGHVEVLGSIEEAIALARNIASEAGKHAPPNSRGAAHVFITGSVHLVGGALEILETHRPTQI
jgi:folylpolyglutamate synthase